MVRWDLPATYGMLAYMLFLREDLIVFSMEAMSKPMDQQV